MSRDRTKVIGHGVFGAALLAALAFGATQAGASPSAPQRAERACAVDCNKLCIRGGHSGGYCYDGYDCHCY
ncbi:MAG TPA: hypothetical protein VHG28_05800 [Longimicrobiaceae bacterium]|nr:hypothetical protein [Longimicrobiaceae bacterium]